MENITLIESLRELAVVAAGVSFAKAVEYVAVKIYAKIDSKIDSPLD